MIIPGNDADLVLRTTAFHRSRITGKDFDPLILQMCPEGRALSIDQVAARFRAFESEINPRWDGSIA